MSQAKMTSIMICDVHSLFSEKTLFFEVKMISTEELSNLKNLIHTFL